MDAHTQRINELATVEAGLAHESRIDGKYPAGIIARCVRESITPPDPIPDQIANLATSGLTGLNLVRALWETCPQATRTDAFTAIGMIVSLFECDRLGLLADLYRTEAGLRAEPMHG